MVRRDNCAGEHGLAFLGFRNRGEVMEGIWDNGCQMGVGRMGRIDNVTFWYVEMARGMVVCATVELKSTKSKFRSIASFKHLLALVKWTFQHQVKSRRSLHR